MQALFYDGNLTQAAPLDNTNIDADVVPSVETMPQIRQKALLGFSCARFFPWTAR